MRPSNHSQNVFPSDNSFHQSLFFHLVIFIVSPDISSVFSTLWFSLSVQTSVQCFLPCHFHCQSRHQFSVFCLVILIVSPDISSVFFILWFSLSVQTSVQCFLPCHFHCQSRHQFSVFYLVVFIVSPDISSVFPCTLCADGRGFIGEINVGHRCRRVGRRGLLEGPIPGKIVVPLLCPQALRYPCSHNFRMNRKVEETPVRV